MKKNDTKSKKAIAQPESQPELVAYDLFAPYYDQYMKHVDYDIWLQKILSLYNLHTSTKLKEILELACGTANVSERLVKMGYNVTASDRSAEMIKYASQKAHAPKLLQAEMTEELLPDAYDLVILIFDSINYLIDKQDIAKMLNNVYNTLRKNGIFIFDISTYKNSLEHFNDYINIDEAKDHLLIHRAGFDPVQRLQKTRLTIFKRSDNHYMRMDEEHNQRIYYVQELLHLIDDSYLDCVGIYSLVYDKNQLKSNSRKLDHQYSRLFFVLKKTKND